MARRIRIRKTARKVRSKRGALNRGLKVRAKRGKIKFR